MQDKMTKCQQCKINNVIDVTKTVKFIRARALNYRQFVALLEKHDNEHGDIRYHTVSMAQPGQRVKKILGPKSRDSRVL